MTDVLKPSAHVGGTVYHTDLLTLCGELARRGQKVDMILCDLPYQVHEAAWDTIIPIEPMWEAFKRVIRPRGAIVLTCVMGFGWQLIAANPKMFKYDMVGVKTTATDFMNAKNKPLRGHENILVFSDGTTANGSPNRMPYYPQMLLGDAWVKKNYAETRNKSTFGAAGRTAFQVDHLQSSEGGRYPTTVLKQKTQDFEGNLHPNQKDAELFRYLIRTYTRPGELVFDPCVGSGTTAVAARAEGRRYIVGDSSLEYYGVTCKRLDAPWQPMFAALLTA